MKRFAHRMLAAGYDRMTRRLEHGWLGECRGRLLRDLTGDVLEIGAGKGANLPHYRRAARVVAIEPNPGIRALLTQQLHGAVVPVEVSAAPAESLPYPDASFDAVVCTLVLCMVTDPDAALAEAARVLRPSGRLVLLEHVRATGPLGRWQHQITPLWRRLGSGCHPNRDTRGAVERAGFTFERIDAVRALPAWYPVSPMIEAVAVAPARRTAGSSGRGRQRHCEG